MHARGDPDRLPKVKRYSAAGPPARERAHWLLQAEALLPHEPPPARPLVRSVAALVVIDLLFGMWLHVHAPQLIPQLSIVNVTVVGVGGVLGLLPQEWRAGLRKRAVKRLGSDRCARLLWILAALLLVPALFLSSVSVSGDGAAAMVYVARSPASPADQQAATVRPPDTLRIGRGRPEAHRLFVVPPTGSRVWLATDREVARNDQLILPWRPGRWQYPEDFEPMADLVLLPMTSADLSLTHGSPTVVIKDLDDSELAHALLAPRGVVIRWTAEERAPPGRTERRRARLDSLDARDSVGNAFRVRQWDSAAVVHPRRPLHLHEQVLYELQYTNGRVGPIAVVLDSTATELLLDSTWVDPALAAPRRRP